MAQAQVSGPREKHNSWRRNIKQQVEDIVADEIKSSDLKKDADSAWEELKALNNKVDEAMVSGDRAALKSLAAERDAARATLVPRIKAGQDKGYSPEGLPRTYKKGGKVSSASSRADGIAQRGKTRGMMK